MKRVEVESEVQGTLWKTMVAVGDVVAPGDPLVILESMKVEIPVESPVAGRVLEVRVAPEEAVAEDQVLVVIEVE